MPTLDQHQSNDYVKLLLIGDSKSGKTGSLISLVKAGYKLRIVDMDNLLDVLKYFIIKECPELIGNVEYRTLRDERIWTPDGPQVTSPKAYGAAVRMMQSWKYGDVDLGSPAEWGQDCIFVLDSLSRLCDAAYDFRVPLTPVGKGGQYDARAVYGDAQDAVENNIANLTSEGFRTNVIVIGHVTYQEQPDGTIKGFPQGVGAKLSPKIPQYFSTVVLYNNEKGKRTIRTNSTPLIDLANPKPFEMGDKYPIETGLADIFQVLTGRSHAGQDVGRKASTGVVQPIQRQPSGQGQIPVRGINRPMRRT
jgi:hypothetical protein